VDESSTETRTPRRPRAVRTRGRWSSRRGSAPAAARAKSRLRRIETLREVVGRQHPPPPR
jgi:hypothetical protein